MALVNLAAMDDKVSTSIQERVSFNGNVALAQKMQQGCWNLDIDWEEALAEHSGDVLAFQIHQRACIIWASGCSKAPIRYCKPAASICAKKLASVQPRSNSRHYKPGLQQLKHDVDRSEARLQQLLEKIRSR